MSAVFTAILRDARKMGKTGRICMISGTSHVFCGKACILHVSLFDRAGSALYTLFTSSGQEEVMTILHCADLHLGRRPRGGRGSWSDSRYDDYFSAFDRIVTLAIERGVGCLTIGGDVFDSNAMLPATLAKTEAVLERLRVQRIPVVATWGNHDRPGYGGDSEFWLAYLAEKGLLLMPRAEKLSGIHETEWRFDPVVLDGISFWTPGWWMSQNEAVLSALAAHLSGQPGPHAVLAHLAPVGGGYLDQGAVPADAIRQFQDLVCFMGGGHFHSWSQFPREQPFFFVPGSPEYFDIGERAADKAVVLYDTVVRSFERIPVIPRPKHDLVLETDTPDCEHFVRKQLEPRLKNLQFAEGDMIRLEVLCPPGIWLDAGWCEHWLENVAGFGKASVSLRHPAGQSDSSGEGDGSQRAIEEIIHEYIATCEIFRDVPEETLRLLQEMAAALDEPARGDEIIHERLEAFFAATHKED